MRPSTYRVLGWCAVGILLGLAFPVAAWVWASGGNLGWATIRAAHRDQPVLTIIDTAPLVLGIAGAIVGVLQQRIHEAYDRCETTVRERTGELQTANNRLVSLMDAKDQFVSTVGHELRTPITSVTGFAEVLRESHRTSTPEEISELVEVIALQAAEVVDILDDLLVASRGQISGLSIENQHLDLSDLSTECIRALCRVRDGSTTRRFTELESAPVNADPGRVRQILRNLLTNADRYGGQNRRIQTGTEDDYAYVRVCDDGSGVPSDDVDTIFEPYAQSAHSGTASGSVGIGLSVSRTLARLMGGDLFYRREGVWTVFELRLPLDDAVYLAAGSTR